MNLPVSPRFRLERDPAPAQWIVDGVEPWGAERVRLWSFMPSVFESYARILHPACRVGHNRGTARWSDLARRTGVTIGPSTGFREVSGVDPSDDPAWDDVVPPEGSLDQTTLAVLALAVAPFTSTRRCWIAAWNGWGSWGPGSSSTLIAFRKRRFPFLRSTKTRRTEPRTLDEEVEAHRAFVAGIPTVQIPNRAYFLFSTSLFDVASFEIGGWYQSPSILWPDDRAWCVVTEVDGYSSYVGGTAECISAVLNAPEIEAISVPADVPMDPGPY